MRIRRLRGWELPERGATAESVARDRRRVLRALAIGGLAATFRRSLFAAEEPAGRVSQPLTGTPPPRDPRFALDRALTEEKVAARHNIFDEFAPERDKVWEVSARFRTDPWKIHIGGQVKAAKTLDVGDLARRFGLEERLYRHRCVETWAMAVPWTGFPLAKLVALAEPLGSARFVRFVSAARPEEMPAWYTSRRVFPYYEALTLVEATNELAFLATGIYGRSLPPQHGAPIRLVVPWKYGFKSAKSLVAMQFTAERPGTFWNDLAPDKYGFSSNVDPTETKPWPQSHETMLGTNEQRPTLPYNGYGEWVARLYA